MKFHPYADVFPLIDDADFDALVDDIKAHGLREKIWTYEGKILDGRNRFLACKTAKVDPQFREYKGKDALAFVISLNMQRRHLTESQRAMASARIATLRPGQRADQVEGVPIGTAAQMTGASERSTKRARKVLDKGSKDLQRAVDQGELSVSKAAKVVDLPKPQQLAAAKAKPAPEIEPDAEDDAPERPSEEEFAAIDREIQESEARVLRADDVTAGYHDELKRQAAEIAVLKTTRDGYMRGKDSVTQLLKTEQAKVARLEKKLKSAEEEIEKLRKQIAMMEAA